MPTEASMLLGEHSAINMLLAAPVFLAYIVSAFSQSQSWYNMSDLQILDQLLENYDRRMTPTFNKVDTPTIVSCEIYVRSFGSINPTTMDYEVDLYLRQTWTDERLRNLNLTQALDLSDPKLVQMIWKPELFFANAKKADFQYVTVPNVLVRVNPTGEILYMLRLKLTFACMMDLYKYPLDTQVCTMEMASFSKTTKELVLQWLADPIKLPKEIKLPQFEIEKVVPSYCNATFHIGEYSCIVAEFYLSRSIGFHMVESYLPTVLIVVISWVSFWLDVGAIPARVTLGVTTLLTISSKGSGIQANLPQVSYVKAIDVWMGACTTFVFAALLEFTFINYRWRQGLSRKSNSNAAMDYKSTPNNEANMESRVVRPCNCNGCDSSYHLPSGNEATARYIDRICRIAFPLGFLFFNIFYWLYYMLQV